MQKITRKFWNVEKKAVTLRQNLENMRIIDKIKQRFFKAAEVLFWNKGGYFSRWDMCNYHFATVLWYNICDLLTDLIEDVRIIDKTSAPAFSESGQKRLREYNRQHIKAHKTESYVVIYSFPKRIIRIKEQG